MLRLKKIRLLLAIAILLAGAALVLTVVLKVRQVSPQAPSLGSMPKDVDMVLQKVHYSEVKDGETKWDLFADRAVLDRNNDMFHLEGVSFIVASRSETGNITVTAERAAYDSKSKDVKLMGKVRAKSVSGMKFSTDSALYLANRSLIKTSDPVRFSDGKIEISGVGMELSTATRDLKIMKDVTADLRNGSASDQ